MTVEVLRQGNLSEAVVPLKRDSESRARITSKKIVRICHVIVGILPYVKITYRNRHANSVKKCMFKHKEVDSQPNKKPKKSKQLGCVSGLRAAEIQVDFTEEFKILQTEPQRAILKR